MSRGSGADVDLRGNGCVAAEFNLDGRETRLEDVPADRIVTLQAHSGGVVSAVAFRRTMTLRAARRHRSSSRTNL